MTDKSTITKDQVIEWLSAQSVIEIAELVKALEGKWGVSAAAPVAAVAAAPVAAVAAAPVAEKTEFKVLLKEFPADKKISVIKTVKDITQLGLKESKQFVERDPKERILVDAQGNPMILSEEEATKLQDRFKEIGAVAELD